MIDNKNGIYTLDSGYGRANMAAVYLIIQNDQIALVETAHAKSLINVEAALARLGLGIEAVKYIILTHIHLDHAGGAGVYMEKFTNAQLIVHPRGCSHMINPAALEASVINVYGSEFVQKMYGRLVPVAAKRIVVAEDGLELDLGGRKLLCRHTPGHANHHIALVDTVANVVFTGDVFGVAYPEVVDAFSRRFIFPTTTPVNFNPQLMHNSIDLIASYKPRAVYPTHFGELNNVEESAGILHRMVDDFVDMALACRYDPDVVVTLTYRMNRYMQEQAYNFRVTLSPTELQQIIELDNKISAQGLVIWLDRLEIQH